jgi:hypothetical protein
MIYDIHKNDVAGTEPEVLATGLTIEQVDAWWAKNEDLFFGIGTTVTAERTVIVVTTASVFD